MKRRWIFVTLLLGLAALGITGGAVLAQAQGTEGSPPPESFVSRVATILGLEEAQVQEAFDQAAEGIANERIQQKLDRLVEKGVLTQEQADEYVQWYQSRPDLPFHGLSRGFRGHGSEGLGFFGARMHGMKFWKGVPPTPTPEDPGATSL